jgi:hypothetical protein
MGPFSKQRGNRASPAALQGTRAGRGPPGAFLTIDRSLALQRRIGVDLLDIIDLDRAIAIVDR